MPESGTIRKNQPTVLLANDENHAIGMTGPVVLTIWRRETLAEDVARLGALLNEQARRYGRAVGAFMLIEEHAPLPSSAARRVMGESLCRASVAFLAIMFEGTGFRAAAVRGVVTGVGLLVPPPYPYKAFALLEDAAIWIGRQATEARLPHVTPLTIVDAVTRLRERP